MYCEFGYEKHIDLYVNHLTVLFLGQTNGSSLLTLTSHPELIMVFVPWIISFT
jgi:hypothetical protein